LSAGVEQWDVHAKEVGVISNLSTSFTPPKRILFNGSSLYPAFHQRTGISKFRLSPVARPEDHAISSRGSRAHGAAGNAGNVSAFAARQPLE
jgi:hypothetical protein